ncbi:MAG TPA: hypothetical protein VIS06_18435 [Mycobacteriales bacterium]
MDRYDAGEFAGLAGIAAFFTFVWPPLALLAASVALLIEVQMRSRGAAPVRGTRPLLRLVTAARAAHRAWVSSAATGTGQQTG